MNRTEFARRYLTLPKLAFGGAICSTFVVALALAGGFDPLIVRIYVVCCAVGWINFLVQWRLARQRTR